VPENDVRKRDIFMRGELMATFGLVRPAISTHPELQLRLCAFPSQAQFQMTVLVNSHNCGEASAISFSFRTGHVGN
jgi:hypothetical protein